MATQGLGCDEQPSAQLCPTAAALPNPGACFPTHEDEEGSSPGWDEQGSLECSECVRAQRRAAPAL